MSLSVGFIGARDGETLTAAPSAKQCRGTTMKIRGNFPPLKVWLDNLEKEVIRDKLNNYSFFKNKSLEEREDWLNTKAYNNGELYLEDVDDLYVKFISIGGDFILKSLSQNDINLLLQGNPDDGEGYWLLRDVYNRFPRKPNSRAKKHTLVFRPANWVVVPDNQRYDNNFVGMCFNLETGDIFNGSNKDVNRLYIVPVPDSIKDMEYGFGPVAITTDQRSNQTSSSKLTFDKLLLLCVEMGLDDGIMKEVYGLISWFNPSPHKSLIQKILRTRCTEVEYAGKLYRSEEVLITSFCMLMCHPGSFVPNIQRFVCGLESALKRLAVSIAEDAYIVDGRLILSLLCGAWLAQNEKFWTPSDDMIKRWIKTALMALESPYSYKYDCSSNNPGKDNTTGIKKGATCWYAAYYLISSIRSFHSDEIMFRSIADNNGLPNENMDQRESRIMPIVHCIDQHSFTDIVHYFPHNIIKSLVNYKAVFNRIWNEVTGINPRNPEYHGFDFVNGGSNLFHYVRNAQTMIWISRTYQLQPMPVTEETVTYNYKLSDGWLSSFIGSHEIRVGNSTAIVMIHPNDILLYVAFKRPSRDKNSSTELTEIEKNRSIDIFKERLRKGIVLSNVPPTLNIFKGSIVYLDNDEYYILMDGITKKWSDICNLVLKFNLHPEITVDNFLYKSLTTTGDGIMINADVNFSNYLDLLPQEVLRRSLIYLSFKSEIELYHIGRDGNGIDYTVTIEDTAVNELLAVITVLYPAALVKKEYKYIVKNGPLMWILINNIKRKLLGCSSGENVWKLPLADSRKLWEHQIDAIDNLLKTKRDGKKVRLIWITPGLGKTAIVVNYIAQCIEDNIMPKYCVYTLPPSALTTVIREFNMRGIPYVHLDMRVNIKSKKDLIPGVINLIYHDHLRMANQIKEHASQMLFIVDEFHKTLNATIRTSLALELSHLSCDVLAMTGTLIKDTHVEPLIKWLEQAVDFEVTPKNYWVALSSIISRKIQTKIVVERIIRQVPFNSDEKEEYLSIVPPSLGGTARNINFSRAVDISYDAISRELINMTLLHVNSGLGVFLVSRNITHQTYLENLLRSNGIINIFLIGNGKSISLTPTDPPPGSSVPDVVITTVQHSEGYNLTRFMVMITGVYFSNQCTREQLEARINRIDSISPSIRIIIVHAGIISYIHNNYEKSRSLSAALKGFIKDINLNETDISLY